MEESRTSARGSSSVTSTTSNNGSRGISSNSSAVVTGISSFLSQGELKVFKKFVRNYKTTHELRREDAVALEFMFGPTIQQVFEMIEEDHVTVRQNPVTRRVLVEVCGKSGDSYWIPPGHSLCQCMAYIHGKKEYCKHVLAAHLYLAITPTNKYKNISDDELSKIYKDCLEG